MSAVIRVTLRTEVHDVYEVDVDKLLADEYFEDVDMTSEETVASRIEDWLVDERGQHIEAPWARRLAGAGSGEREVYEVDLRRRESSDG